MTTQSRLQSWQERKTLFAQGRHIATNAAKSLCSRQTAETARHLLLHFHHAQIPLGQIVVKIHPQIFQEAEDRFLVFAQPVEQGACGTLFDSPLGPRGAVALGVTRSPSSSKRRNAVSQSSTSRGSSQRFPCSRACWVACFIERRRSLRSAAQTDPCSSA